ncbi:MFS general substrate transporter [Piedraia hortae CBS 480.64]|uniref:MFS general substrate transporter n=1 Tax=Piedraia hortae CBS 480.64 TaxID=1314780 RepID=A0A6A7C4N0_9PEZI|nr:MFS general substrate transporter [Piedraia hortae CBS 480.64]
MPPKPTKTQTLRILFLSLLLDLLSFTFILPLYPSLLHFYQTSTPPSPLLHKTLLTLQTYKSTLSLPPGEKYDTILLGGALGSLFSFCQALTSPFIGTYSDKYGRRPALLLSLAGNILSLITWTLAPNFEFFLLSRVIAGLSEGNIQIALTIVSDVSSEKERGGAMALVGACFSIAFTFGPALGAGLSRFAVVERNPFAVAAGVALGLVMLEAGVVYVYLPETRAGGREAPHGRDASRNRHASRTNSHALLNTTQLLFVLVFSGMEFSVPFVMFEMFGFSAEQRGRVLGYIGLVASLLQGGVVRRMKPLRAVQVGVAACAAAFFTLAGLETQMGLYAAATLLAVTSATVVMGLNSLSSLEAGSGERGERLGNHRRFGQVGRTLGPVVFCSVYWWVGRERAFIIGGLGMVGVGVLVGMLRQPVER